MISYLSYLEIDIMDVSLESNVQHLLTFKLPSAIHQEIMYVLTIGYVYVSLTEIPPKINPINLYDITFLLSRCLF